jgi:MHS family proline/betaine transporter-like MFS transporter
MTTTDSNEAVDRPQTTPPPAALAARRRAIVAGAIGNAVEWYDFAIYGMLAAVFAGLFFPSGNETAQLLAAFALFGVGFVMRPLGAVVFGHFGDRIGRRNALAWAVVLMSVATLGIGLLPTYPQVGMLAPILLCLARLLQGFSAGGEWGGGVSFLVEHAPPGRRGFYGSWQQVSVACGFLAGSAVSALVSAVLTPEDLTSWGWRIPFLVGGVLGAVGLYLRLRLEETPAFEDAREAGRATRSPLREVLATCRPQIAVGFLFPAAWNAGYYVILTYMPTFIARSLGYSVSEALLASMVCLGTFAVLLPFLGALSDRVGRRPLLLGATIGFVVLSYPLFLLMLNGGYTGVLLAQVALATVVAVFSGPGPAAMAEMFPTAVRYSGLSLGYNFSSVVFGGTAPFIATWLIATAGSPLAPAFYVMALALITLGVVLRMPETAHRCLR